MLSSEGFKGSGFKATLNATRRPPRLPFLACTKPVNSSD